MFDYDQKGERATRDVVSRGIYAEMRKNNNPEQEGVYISMSHLGPDNVRQKFKGMVKRCADSGFDLAAGKVAVVPTAHYFMGGVVVSVGVANSTVFGGIAGDVMASDIKTMSLREPDPDALAMEYERAIYPLQRKADLILPLRKELQDLMWEDVGVMRTGAGMERGLTRIAKVSDALMHIGVDDSNLAFNLTWHDFPEPGAMETSEFTVAKMTDGDVKVHREAVQFTIVRPGQTILAENEPETLVAMP